jgi:hypothetical protein
MTRQEMSELQRSLGRIEGKQDQILKSQSDLNKVQEGHGEAITSLKNRQHWYHGGLGVVVFGVLFFRDSINKIFG